MYFNREIRISYSSFKGWNAKLTVLSGLVYLPMGERLDQLQIPIMVPKNTEPHRTAFTVSVDYVHRKQLFVLRTLSTESIHISH